MKIILSPAKKMRVETDSFATTGLPVFLDRTEILLSYLQSLSLEELKDLWKCNQNLAELNFERVRNMDLYHNLTPSILSYEGIAYRSMAPEVFTQSAFDYVQDHLRILSGFYGVLKPFDGVTPYRLELGAKPSLTGFQDLYDFWGDSLYREVADGDHVILNLASKEYAKAVEKYLEPSDRFLTIVFGEWKGDKVIQKATMAKMARGDMVRYLAENQITDLTELRSYHNLNYRFHEELSSEKKYVFLREP